MHKIIIAAFVAAQFVTAAPAGAANLAIGEASRTEIATFAGARLRLPLGASRSVVGDRLRLSIAAGPAAHRLGDHGRQETRIAQGLELGLRGDKLRLDLAGRPVSHILGRGEAPDGPRNQVSTIGWVAIGVGVVLVSVVALASLCADGEICGSE